MNEEIKGIEIDNELEEKIDESLQNDQRKFILKEKMMILRFMVMPFNLRSTVLLSILCILR